MQLSSRDLRGSSRIAACLMLGGLAAGFSSFATAAKTSALSDEAKPLQIEAVGSRVRPLVEIGDTFLGAGNINTGIRLPTGAVWQPNLLVWGTFRSSLSTNDDEQITGDDHFSEWANRLDLFAQVSLSQTDRIVVGFRPLDEDGEFAGYRFHPDGESVGVSDSSINMAFFESNLAEIFPGSGDRAGRNWDMDLAVGRMPWLFQEGTLVNDRMDSVALSRNNLLFLPGATNTRVSLIYGWNDVNRSDNLEDDDAKMYGIFTETDFPKSTVNFDLVSVKSDSTGDGIYAGISATQRIGKYNTAFRVVHSEPQGRSTLQTTGGTLAVAEVSWTPPYTYDNIYTNFFWAVDEFSSASRDAATGGPLALVGILYAATGLGAFPAPLGNDAIESFGGAVGYQKFFPESRSQLIVEFGARTDTDSSDRRQFALGARYQKALGKRYVLRFDAYAADREGFDTGWGLRTEFQVKL